MEAPSVVTIIVVVALGAFILAKMSQAMKAYRHAKRGQ